MKRKVTHRLTLSLALLAAAAGFSAMAADQIAPRAVTTMSELMLKIVQPNSDAVFYISRNPPGSDEDWAALEVQTLMLAESANLLMLPGYVRDQQRWMADSQLMREASVAAYRAARAKDLSALEELNNDLYTSCESCHEVYR